MLKSKDKKELFKALMKSELTTEFTVPVKKQTVKIVSSWTHPGGGTIAHINLTNLLNDNGYDCTFYGPNDWHLDKCKSAKIDKCLLGPDDILISHFIEVPAQVKVKKHILYCHEKDVFPLKEIDLARYDSIVFVSNSQKEWQAIDHPSVVIPPIVRKIKWKNPKNKIAGVIGSIDENKQTHLSIKRAIGSGYDKVMLFGQVNDTPYFDDHVKMWVDSGHAVLADHEDDPQAMYGRVSAVYHSSLSETYGLVEAECKLAGIPFNGMSNGQPILDNEEIFRKWKKLLI
tara:strand:+ start:774 stop:1631 length:858 start_codon:yes stop_codon:yes gene_type:complete